MKMNNKVYDVLVYVCQVVLPAIGALYFALAEIWGLPYTKQVIATIAAITAFLGTLLRISNHNYKKMNIDGIKDVNEDEFIEGIPEDDNKPTI